MSKDIYQNDIVLFELFDSGEVVAAPGYTDLVMRIQKIPVNSPVRVLCVGIVKSESGHDMRKFIVATGHDIEEEMADKKKKLEESDRILTLRERAALANIAERLMKIGLKDYKSFESVMEAIESRCEITLFDFYCEIKEI
jgi:hypothetical protein